MLLARPPLRNPRSFFHAKDLHVIIPYSNHLRFQSRKRLLEETIHHLLDTGVTVYVVDLAHGDRPHLDFLPTAVNHIKLRTRDIMWHKENQINIGAEVAIANEAKNLAWIDGDIHFTNPHWATETLEALQTWDVVQPWHHAVDLNYRGDITADENKKFFVRSFCAAWLEDLANGMDYTAVLPSIESYGADDKGVGKRRKPGHFGYAWACTAEAFRGFGGLIDFAIVGAGDYFMAHAFIGILERALTRRFDTETPGYRRRLLEFQERCNATLKINIGFVHGTITHGFHGPKAKRGYMTRARILERGHYDPDLDLTYDDQGLHVFARDNYYLRDGLRAYFTARDEDSQG